MNNFNYNDWKKRIANRQDITGMVTHLTKPNMENTNNLSEEDINLRAVDNLIKILQDKILLGSTTEKGLVVGKTHAVCFQEAPFYGIIQNVEHEKSMRMEGKSSKIRYCGVGLAFSKFYIFDEGGRPVIYEQTEKAKKLLEEHEYWRIVNFQLLSDNSKIIDWTHEREWRLPGNFCFDLKLAHAVLYDKQSYDYFYDKCPKDIVKAVHGVTILKSFLM